jgi:deoxyadenosine/deoxycytidine kinase
VATEPVEEWCRPVLPNGSGMLQSVYANPAANGFAFQMFVLLSRVRQADALAACGDTRPVLMERCMSSDFELFGKTLRRDGLMSDEQWTAYCAWHGEMSSKLRFGAPPQAIVYMRCDPAVCIRRIKERGREGERVIDEKYLYDLHQAHETWVSSLQGNDRTRVLILDASQDGDEAIARIADLTLRFILEVAAASEPV